MHITAYTVSLINNPVSTLSPLPLPRPFLPLRPCVSPPRSTPGMCFSWHTSWRASSLAFRHLFVMYGATKHLNQIKTWCFNQLYHLLLVVVSRRVFICIAIHGVDWNLFNLLIFSSFLRLFSRWADGVADYSS
jgi:hypothetical protein